MDAAMHGHAEVIKLLLEAGAIANKAKDVSVATSLVNNIRGTDVHVCVRVIMT